MAYAEYLRKSRYDNPDETLEETLARHRKLQAEYMVRNNISVLPEDIYEEVVSGDSLYARPQMLRLLEAVEAGKYEGVVCMDIQRLGRGSMTDQGAILDAFKYSHTKILTPTKTYDLDDDTDETYTEFETFMGRQELKMIKKRLQRGIKATVEAGGYISNAPYGYEQTRVGKMPTLRIKEDEASFVRMMFDMYANQGMGCQRIADTISAMGARPHRGEAFSRNTIRRILKSPVYIGKVVWNQKSCIQPGKQGNNKHMVIYHPPEKWIVVDGIHPAIVDEDIFYRVQKMFDGHSHSPTFTGVIENPLSGIVICGNCGGRMQRQMHERGGPYLMCQRRGCIVSSQLPLVEEAILNHLREEMIALPANQEPHDSDNQKDLTEALRTIDRDIRTARQQDNKLHDLLEQGVYDIDTFMERHAMLTDRIAKLSLAKERLRPQEKQLLDIEGMQQRIRAVLDAYHGATPQARSDLLKSVIERVVYHKEPGAKPAGFELEMYLKPMYL